MVFSSNIFLFLFLPLFLLLYFVPKSNFKYKNIILLIFSLLFMLWGSGLEIIILIAISFINYLYGILYLSFKHNKEKKQKVFLIFTVIINIGILFVYKYLGFVSVNLLSLSEIINFPIKIPEIFLSFALPIGISFYTFQALSYSIDVYRKDAKPNKNFLQILLYVSMFPQIIAGPIVRYKDVKDQISKREINQNRFYQGIIRFLTGIGKKVLLANTCGLIADNIFNTEINLISPLTAWFGIFAYTMQIYHDFSAYSDMAIGLGKMIGFDFLENFNYPYLSKSITEFWRRWHISLSSFFRDYLYIPLGGSREGKAKTYRNLMIIFFLCGLWHGAQWTFVILGVWHGLFLIIERIGFKKIVETKKVLNIIYTFLIVMLGWVIFRSGTISYAFEFIKKLFFIGTTDSTGLFIYDFLNLNFILALAISFIVSLNIYGKINNFFEKINKQNVFKVIYTIFIFLIFILSIASLYNGNYNPFIYFQF